MLPVVLIKGRNGARVWERSIVETFRRGVLVETEYNQMSRDLTMIMVIKEPLREPRIHISGLMLGKMEDLEVYAKEIVEGIHDSWVREGKWSYSYHDRMTAYPTPKGETVDQIEYIVKKLSEVPYSRRAQAITWVPWHDPKIDDAPCLQRVSCRIYNDKLVMETSWRSRDAYKAAHMNIYAMTELQKFIAKRISEETGREIKVGEYVDFSNYYHIYERDWRDVEERFLRMLEKRPFRTKTDKVTGRIIVRGRAITTEQYRRMISPKRLRGD